MHVSVSVSIDMLGDEGSIPAKWSVSAWGVNAPWDPSETYFHSSSNILNAVWGLSLNMLHRGVLDTYTDSNARERRPYEADGPFPAEPPPPPPPL